MKGWVFLVLCWIQTGFCSQSDTEQHLQWSFFKTHALMFFFSSSCPHCHQVAPILKAWAKDHEAVVDARSFDNMPLSDFRSPQPATQALITAAYQNEAIRYPALFVINQTTHVLYPVVIGSFTFAELNLRMDVLLPKIIAYERGKPL